MDPLSHVPELGEARFLTEVMCFDADRTEVQHDRELLKRAQALGIMATLPTISETKRITSSSMSDSTESTSRDQTFSILSDSSTTAQFTPHSSVYGLPSPNPPSPDSSVYRSQARSKNLSFATYEKYLAQLDVVPEEPKLRKNSAPVPSSGQSIFSVSTRKSLSGVTTGFRNKWKLRRKPTRTFDSPTFCFSCRSPINKSGHLTSLPCGHANCMDCLRKLADRAIEEESSMPPSCCAQPVPAEALQQALTLEAQESFLNAVSQYSTPQEARVFCCNPVCCEFIPPLRRHDPRMPFAMACSKCQTKVCSSCKGTAHAVGTHCPEDWELLDALKIGGQGSWRRCYRCRKLVELAEAAGSASCTCKAQFCSACGGIWDTTTGCPNVCKGEEELARNRRDEERRAAEAELGETMDREESAKRSAAHPSMKTLLESQEKEMRRLLDFKERAEKSLLERHGASELVLLNKHVGDAEKVKEMQAIATSQLEDCQITEELDLHSTLELAARSIRVRIKHMEAYCDGLGQNPNELSLPPRVVTEQNLRDLGHQYNLRDDLDRQQTAKVNMMRDRQSKRMEELLQKHESELDNLFDAHEKAMTGLRLKHAQEKETFCNTFESRQSRFTARWNLAIEVRCKELQSQDGLRYGPIAPPAWPEDRNVSEDSTQTVSAAATSFHDEEDTC